jgi:hypothetical protein
MKVLRRFIENVKELDDILPTETLLSEGSIEVIENCVRFQIECVFDTLRKETIEMLQGYYAEIVVPSSSLSNNKNKNKTIPILGHEMEKVFLEMVQQVLRQMEPLIHTGSALLSDMTTIFAELVQTQFHHFLKWFNELVRMYTEPKRAFEGTMTTTTTTTSSITAVSVMPALLPPKIETTPQFVLLLACVCQELASEGVAECIQVLIEVLLAMNGGNHQHQYQQQQQHTGSKNNNNREQKKSTGQTADITHMIQVTRETAAELLQHVARVYGNQLCCIVYRGLQSTPWRILEESPRSVQDYIERVVEEGFLIAKELSIALGEENYTLSRTGSRNYRRQSGSSALRSRPSIGSHENHHQLAAGNGAGNLQMDVERLFGQKIQIFGDLELQMESFLFYIWKMVLKGLSEKIRAFDFNKNGLQQMQVNAEFLRTVVINSFVISQEAQEIESLLSDVLSNTRERCLEDELMEQR